MKRHVSEKNGRWTKALLLTWVDAYYAHFGRWPKAYSGALANGHEVTWQEVDDTLRHGGRGFKGGSSLSKFLDIHRRRARSRSNSQPLEEQEILAWVDAFRAQHGRFPTIKDGAVSSGCMTTWLQVNAALYLGLRALPGGSSLPRLIAKHRDYSGLIRPGPRKFFVVTEDDILFWADGFYRRHGRWPSRLSGVEDKYPQVNWNSLDIDLREGYRGLPGGSSLSRLLDAKRRRGASHEKASTVANSKSVIAEREE